MKKIEEYIVVNDEVRSALADVKPLVALESTIIAHGMPYPKNIEMAASVEEIIRQNGAVPATIAILGGKLCIGLTKDQLEILASQKDVWKVSVRDIPYVISKKIPGATTVSATMRIASMAGIKIFVTGGIGGVHREAEKTMDVSADLTEMSQTSVAVISAGMKSILDIGLTLEYLETIGVPVITYGQDEFPAFYSKHSGHHSPLRLDQPAAIADFIRTKWELGMNGSVLVANPVPSEHEIPYDDMEGYILESLNEAKESNVYGKQLTPFLLKFITEKTMGKSLNANIELVKNNARLGAQIAKAL